MNILGMFNLSPMEILIILGLGVLLFGRKLPEVGKYLGKGIVEFKKGLKGLEDEVDTSAAMAPRQEPPSPGAAPSAAARDHHRPQVRGHARTT